MGITHQRSRGDTTGSTNSAVIFSAPPAPAAENSVAAIHAAAVVIRNRSHTTGETKTPFTEGGLRLSSVYPGNTSGESLFFNEEGISGRYDCEGECTC